MRILIDYRPALRQRTGVGQYVHELAAAVRAQLPAPDSLVLFSSSWKDRLSPNGIGGVQTIDRRFPVRVLNAAWHRLEWPPIEWLAGRVDIAHSGHPLLMPARHAAQAVTIYDLDFLDHPERTEAEIRRDYPRLAPDHARRADLVVTISDYSARAIRERLGVTPDRLAVCPPGAPAATPRVQPAAAGPIVFVGTIEPRKNLPALFAAYERVVNGRPDAPALKLAGRSGEHSPAILADLAARRALAGRVDYMGYVTDEERQRLYREASMLVLPSLDEGFGMTAVEAMQAGLPVIAARTGALPEVVGDAGVLVDPLDEAQLANAIERLLANPDERRRRAEAGLVRARRFSWEASAATLIDAYRRVLARRDRRS